MTYLHFLLFLNIAGGIAFILAAGVVPEARKRFLWNFKHLFSSPNPYAQAETGKERAGHEDFTHSFKNVYREAIRKLRIPEMAGDWIASVLAVVMIPTQIVLALIAFGIGVFS